MAEPHAPPQQMPIFSKTFDLREHLENANLRRAGARRDSLQREEAGTDDFWVAVEAYYRWMRRFCLR